MLNVLPQNSEVQEVKGHGRGGGVSLLVLLPEPNLFAEETEMWLMGH